MVIAKSLAAFAGILILWGCAPRPDLEAVKSQLLETDREFSRMSVREGSGAAFLAYMAAEATVYPYKGRPIKGRDTYKDLVSQMAEAGVKSGLEWEPHFSDVARSGDLGYTLGTFRSTLTNTDGSEAITTGNYITVWKKQVDGIWKFVFDGGNQD